MTTLYEKIAKLPPSLLPKVERFVDSLPATDVKRNAACDGICCSDGKGLYDKNDN